MKLLTTTLALLAFTSTLFAQDLGPFTLWAEGGPVSSRMVGNSVIENSDPLLSNHFGLSVEYRVTEALGVRTGVSSVQKGFKRPVFLTDDTGTLIDEGTAFFRFDYLVIPATVHYQPLKAWPVEVAAGGWWASFRKARQVTDAQPPFNGESDISSAYTDSDYGFSVGLCYRHSFKQAVSLGINLMYEHGLTNISAVPLINDGTIETRSVRIALLVGIG